MGENLAFSSNDPPVFSEPTFGVGITELVDLWINEGRAYDYGTIDDSPLFPGTETCDRTTTDGRFGCGHFTQVWFNLIYFLCVLYIRYT